MRAAEREVWEETGIHVQITGFLGIWMDSYSDDTETRPEATMNVFYHAVPVEDGHVAQETDEASEIAWFNPDALPDEIAFPASQRLALTAWRQSFTQGRTVTHLLDRP